MLLQYLDALGDVEASEAKCMHFIESIDAGQTQPMLVSVCVKCIHIIESCGQMYALYREY